MESHPSTWMPLGRFALRCGLASAFLSLSLLPAAALAFYSGRAGKPLTGVFALGYDSEFQLESTGEYANVSGAVTGDVSATATATLPRLKTGNRTTVSLSALSAISTMSVTVVPWYGNTDATGNWIWTAGPALTLTPAQTTGTSGSLYASPRQYLDTDGATLMILQPTSLTSGPVRLFTRVN